MVVDKLKRGAVGVLRKIYSLLVAASNPTLMKVIILVLCFSIALTLRLVPMKWGIYLNEFDPFYEYYLAEKLLEKGNGDVLKGVAWWFSWWFDPIKERDHLFWAPYGRDVRRSSQPGAAIFSALTYVILKNIFDVKVDLYTVHALVPPIGAALASIAIYFFGKELYDDTVGVLSSLFLSVSWPFIYRTNLGAKHEGLAVPFMILAFYFLLKAYRRKSVLYSILSGLSLGGVVLSWGAYLYPWNLIALTTLVWLVFHPDDKKAALTYIPANMIATLFVAITPRFGPQIALFSIGSALPLTATILSILVLIGGSVLRFAEQNIKRIVVVSGVALIIALIALWKLGILASISSRILAVIIPLWREVGVTTVGEHIIPPWSMLFSDYKSIMVFSFAGALALLGKKSYKNLFAFFLWFSSLYAATSMARLTLLFAPAAAAVAAIGLTYLCERLLELGLTPSRYKRKGTSRDIIALSLVLILLSLAPAIVGSSAIRFSHQPPLILSSQVTSLDYNYQYPDWLSALEWIRANVPRDATIATWWDYGYWISVNTGRKTTCDNATLNSTQIRLIARAFLSNETVALKIFKELGVEYVVVFEPFQYVQIAGMMVFFPGYGGDFSKSAQMARWIGLNPDTYIKTAWFEYRGRRLPLIVPNNTPEALNATLYRMLFARTPLRMTYIFEPLPYYNRPVPGYDGPLYRMPSPSHFRLVYVSEPNGWILVYKVIYEEGSL